MTLESLIIGGSGFIGTHLVKQLMLSGRNITVLDSKTSPPQDRLPGVKYITGDFSDPNLIRPLVSEHHEVVHLAYATQPNTSFDDPLADLSQNLPPTVQLFDIVAQYGARLLLVSSGGTVYGEADLAPISEDHATYPISPYGVTKITLEKYAYLYAATKDLQVICVRPSNPFGPGQMPFSGQGFISTAMALALQGKPVSIFGKEGTVRDYLYIDDVVNAMVTVLNKGVINEVYNIGSGTGYSNSQIINAMRPLLEDRGIQLHIRHLPERPFDVSINILNSDKLRALGWTPSITLNEGLKKTLAWLSALYVNGKFKNA